MKKEYQIHLNKQLQMQREKFKEKMLMMEHTADISAPNPKVVNRMALKEIQRGMRAEMKEADSTFLQFWRERFAGDSLPPRTGAESYSWGTLHVNERLSFVLRQSCLSRTF